MKEKLKRVLGSISKFEASELEVIVELFENVTCKKNSFLLREGEVCKKFYFVSQGCVRTCFVSNKAQIKTRYILLENHIGTALASFISQQPSFEFIEAIEDSKLLALSHSNFYKLTKNYHAWNQFYQRILEMAYTFQNKKIEQLVTLTAKQRYEYVLKENPLLLQRVSNKVAASYLDIREETLSRLKGE